MGGAPPDDESDKERVNRELIELLNELRVALPGVQVLFAFLLTVPFSSGFGSLHDAQRTTYFVTFLLTLTASTLLMAPTAYHRLRFRAGDKERMLRTMNRFAIVGTVCLALAISSAALLVADLLYRFSFAAGVGALALGGIAWCWFGLPLTRKARDDA
jgi:predicted membrane channel-forming protein YqfA (hemolysin III family)